jgi:metal-responsive CopG/Arc/MetJ family transcriptional regulator
MEIQFDSHLWKQFEQVAREQRQNPARLLAQVVREYLEIYEDEKLFQQMQRAVRKSGYKEEDAVKLVRRVRQEKRMPSDTA